MENFTLIKNGHKISKDAEILAEALPLLNRYNDETFIIKYSGSALDNPHLSEIFARDVVSLKKSGINVIIVHGGSLRVNSLLEKLNISHDYSGLPKIPPQSTADMIEMIMSGYINKGIVSQLSRAGGMAVGLSGKDGSLIEARRQRKTKTESSSNIELLVDLKFIGEISMINPEVLMAFEETEIIPVISPIAIGEGGETFQVSADCVAGVLASTLAASKLIIVGDTEGINDEKGKLIPEMTLNQAYKIIENNKIKDPVLLDKINACISALEHHTEATHIIDGRIPHALILETLTKKRVGTMLHL